MHLCFLFYVPCTARHFIKLLSLTLVIRPDRATSTSSITTNDNNAKKHKLEPRKIVVDTNQTQLTNEHMRAMLCDTSDLLLEDVPHLASWTCDEDVEDDAYGNFRICDELRKLRTVARPFLGNDGELAPELLALWRREAQSPSHKLNPRWMEQYNNLVKFNADKGHCNAPGDSELGRWVNDVGTTSMFICLLFYNTASDFLSLSFCYCHSLLQQRKEKRKLDRGEKSRLTSVKIQKLEAIGFEWARSGQVLWEQRFRELVAFKAEVRNLVMPNIIHFELVFVILILSMHNLVLHRMGTATFRPSRQIIQVCCFI